MRRRRFSPSFSLYAAASLIAALWSTAAKAELSCPEGGSPAEVEAQASEAFDEGESLFREGEYAAATERFRCSYSLYPFRATLYNIAQSLEHSGDLRGALETYEEYLQVTPEDEDRAVVEQHVGELEQRLAAEDEETLEPSEEEALSPPSDAPPEDSETSWFREHRRLDSTWFWALLGATVASGVVMTATGVSTLRLADRWLEEGNVADRDRARTLQTTTDAFLIILICEALATLAIGIFTDFWSARGGENDAAP